MTVWNAITIVALIYVLARVPTYSEMEALLRVYCATPPPPPTQQHEPRIYNPKKET